MLSDGGEPGDPAPGGGGDCGFKGRHYLRCEGRGGTGDPKSESGLGAFGNRRAAVKALIKIGGSLLDDAASRRDIAGQIARLAATGVRVTVVHGGGKQMTRFLEERGIQSTFVRGLRVSTDETIDAVTKVLAGSVNTQLVAALEVAGVRAVGLTGMDAGLAWADQLDPELGFVGRVVSSDSRLLDTLTGAG